MLLSFVIYLIIFTINVFKFNIAFSANKHIIINQFTSCTVLFA